MGVILISQYVRYLPGSSIPRVPYRVSVLHFYGCAEAQAASTPRIALTCSPVRALQIANMIRVAVSAYNRPFPAILEIPSKDCPYDPTQDSILSRVQFMFGAT